MESHIALRCALRQAQRSASYGITQQPRRSLHTTLGRSTCTSSPCKPNNAARIQRRHASTEQAKLPSKDAKAVVSSKTQQVTATQSKPAEPTYDPKLPARLHPRKLVTNSIATASSTLLGQQATVSAAMARIARRDDITYGFDRDLAKKLRTGKVVRLANEDERRRVVALAQEQVQNVADHISNRFDKNVQPTKVEFGPIPEKYQTRLVDVALRGKYDENKVIEKGEGAQQNQTDTKKTSTSMLLNETYRDKHSRGFLSTFHKLSGGEK